MKCPQCEAETVEEVINEVRLVTCSQTSCRFVEFRGSEGALEHLLGLPGVALLRYGRQQDIEALVWFARLQSVATRLTTLWDAIDDDAVCALLCAAKDSMKLQSIALKLVPTVWPDAEDCSFESRERYLDLLTYALAMSLVNAYHVRVQRHESETGALVRQWLAHGPDSLEPDQLA